jgi:hypothetical protein
VCIIKEKISITYDENSSEMCDLHHNSIKTQVNEPGLVLSTFEDMGKILSSLNICLILANKNSPVLLATI